MSLNMEKRKSKISTESIIKDFISVHGNKYDYSKVDYKTMHDKITVICFIHGEFNLLPNHHLKRKVNCAKCIFEKKTILNKDTTQNFINKANKIHNNRYTYNFVNYGSTAHDKIIITCRKHGNFLMSPNSHLSKKSNCPKCSSITSRRKLLKNGNLGWNRSSWIKRCNNKNSSLYIIECWNNEEKFIKIGITSKEINKRFNKGNLPYNYKILKLITSINAGFIYDLENILLKNSKSFKYIPKLYFVGNTECRTINYIDFKL